MKPDCKPCARSTRFQSIGVFYLPTMHTAEPDGSRGIPFTFMGLCPTGDDVAKITYTMIEVIEALHSVVDALAPME